MKLENIFKVSKYNTSKRKILIYLYHYMKINCLRSYICLFSYILFDIII